MRFQFYLIALLFALFPLLFSACDSADSPAVSSCKAACEANTALQDLNSKVMYKPVKLCQKRCSETEGTCTNPPKSVVHSACIYYGMNAGSMTPRKPGDLSPF